MSTWLYQITFLDYSAYPEKYILKLYPIIPMS